MSEYRPPSFGMIPPVVKNILIINVLCYLATITPIGVFILNFGAAHYFDAKGFGIWQFITYGFLHSTRDIFHIVFNMLAVFMFGSQLENFLGSKKFFSYYMITIIGAMVLQEVINAYQVHQLCGSFIPYSQNIVFTDGYALEKVRSIYSTQTVGASGAVFGLLLAFGMLFPESWIFVYFFPIKAKYLVFIYGAIELYMAVQNNPNDNVAHYAHLGGMLFGFILLKVWKIRKPGSYY
ncbi:DUF1751 domain-containing protein [Solitalea longa]|uniref:DUF1751 domain-containing protein n=1 Tax=Solitalea longa TaxID=2079460 RepID=A0A2S5A9T6_9SPHI|nr:rhomboid family intramembrane serine protease [Solitalea longa]POY39286.1 DUF1751 domain-containing protein [Solitalea longa]